MEDVTARDTLLPRQQLLILSGGGVDFMFKYHLLKNVFKKITWNWADISARSMGIEFNRLPAIDCTTKLFATWLKTELNTNRCKEIYWEVKYGTEIDWRCTWALPFRIKLDPKCCEIHWKIVHRIYPSKVLLFKMGIEQDNICKHCAQIDFIDHFFVTCKLVRPLWSHIESIFNSLHGRVIHLTERDILLGIEDLHLSTYTVLDKMIVIAKLCISKFKYGDHPNLVHLFNRECRLRHMNIPE